jgi:hypothetical protein
MKGIVSKSLKVVCNVAMGNHKNREPGEGLGQARNK